MCVVSGGDGEEGIDDRIFESKMLVPEMLDGAVPSPDEVRTGWRWTDGRFVGDAPVVLCKADAACWLEGWRTRRAVKRRDRVRKGSWFVAVERPDTI